MFEPVKYQIAGGKPASKMKIKQLFIRDLCGHQSVMAHHTQMLYTGKTFVQAHPVFVLLDQGERSTLVAPEELVEEGGLDDGRN